MNKPHDKLTASELQQVLQQDYPLDKVHSSEFIAINRDGKAVYRMGYRAGRTVEFINVYVWDDNGRLRADY
jgi:cytochrome oxidase Cu insertion factor (SCO1/SenC/PrrC family)